MKDQMQRIRAALADPAVRVVSFDVFDTLLLRPFWEPRDLFFFLDREAEGLLPTGDAGRFSVLRQEAARALRKRVAAQGWQDVTLAEIYASIEGFPRETLNALMQAELKLEERFCAPRQSGAALLRSALDCGKRVIAISDMYLPADFIAGLLEKCGVTGVERVFVSCEARKTKVSGALYGYVQQALGVPGRAILHIGDNPKSDVKMARRAGWRACLLPRAAQALQDQRAFKRAFSDFAAPFSNFRALDQLGLRCLLAAAANSLYDDPFAHHPSGGDYAGDAALLGRFAVGLYGMSHALWVADQARRCGCARVLFFARDGYLPWQGYELLRACEPDLPEAVYVRSSRKAMLPLLLADEGRVYAAGNLFRFEKHTPRSLTRLMAPVLRQEAEAALQKQLGDAWQRPFATETDMVRFLQGLRQSQVEEGRMRAAEQGFVAYFTPLMQGSVLTCDVGYNLRNETLLRAYFPDVPITACFTHVPGDLPLRRAALARVEARTLYPFTPFVSWRIRDMFLTEDAPSCVGYAADGTPLLAEKSDTLPLTQTLQREALTVIKAFAEAFGADALRLPLSPALGCLPLESFLQSPRRADRRWLGKLTADDDAESGAGKTDFDQLWRKMRTDSWMARHGLGKMGRHVARFVMLLHTDRDELRRLIDKRLPGKR